MLFQLLQRVFGSRSQANNSAAYVDLDLTSDIATDFDSALTTVSAYEPPPGTPKWMHSKLRASIAQDELVIACPNEWEPMSVGIIQGEFGSGGVVLLDDFVSGEQLMCFAPWVPYSPQTLRELAALNPYERFNRVARNCSIDADKPRSGEDHLTLQDYEQRILARLSEVPQG